MYIVYICVDRVYIYMYIVYRGGGDMSIFEPESLAILKNTNKLITQKLLKNTQYLEQ